ncbi:iron uptake porin [Prochlorococcus marinus]|uniref:SLH domain-containing protein n=1 Tax=Prochlorococcus marinus (strain MIT 9211) TaxID=93059 RepID=A9BBH7_PROM4|nr:iron uptake porin [Prochlorococcus marinus]ABX09189.1 Hypothetical protein P9211_12581 [Prochlorococcus marinus str. MIT 9211]
MKLFQQLLVFPAALGLVAPLAANAAEVNMTDVSKYAAKTAKSIKAPSSAQFSDIVPGDWAYTSLKNLSASYGCVDNAYTQNLNSGLALTRYEAAALVNACLDNGLVASGEGLSSDASLLADEFGVEMAILKGRVDGLEYKLNELSAGQFSSTTKLNGKAAFVVGAVDYEDSADTAVDHGDKLTGTYSYRLDVNTSFNGNDRLYTRIITGNMDGNNPWGDKDGGTYLAVANDHEQVLEVDKLWYEWTKDDLKFWAGPKIENYYMLAASPSIYKPVQKQFALGGNTAAYASSTTAGFGVAWTQPTEADRKWTVSSNYASVGADDATKGILTDEQTKWLTQVTYGGKRWQIAAAYARHGCAGQDANSSCKAWSDYYSTAAGDNATGEGENAYSLRYWWRPAETGIMPSIQLGMDYRELDDAADTEVQSTAAWMVGLNWKDAWIDGNRAGIAFGSREHATDYAGSGDDEADDNLVWEAYYDYQLTDGITITPALFGGSHVYDGSNDDIFGALVQTVFKF